MRRYDSAIPMTRIGKKRKTLIVAANRLRRARSGEYVPGRTSEWSLPAGQFALRFLQLLVTLENFHHPHLTQLPYCCNSDMRQSVIQDIASVFGT